MKFELKGEWPNWFMLIIVGLAFPSIITYYLCNIFVVLVIDICLRVDLNMKLEDHGCYNWNLVQVKIKVTFNFSLKFGRTMRSSLLIEMWFDRCFDFIEWYFDICM